MNKHLTIWEQTNLSRLEEALVLLRTSISNSKGYRDLRVLSTVAEAEAIIGACIGEIKSYKEPK